MEKLASFITSTFQDINEIVLTVNTDNPHAMALYRQQGYQYMGDSMFVGRPVHIMALTIKSIKFKSIFTHRRPQQLMMNKGAFLL